MWGRILNKRIYSITLAFSLLLICLSQPAFAFPEYTSRQKALKLAAVLDHGYFKSIKISSVFVKNRGKDDFYLQAILDDGSSRKWLLNRIREWTQTDELISVTTGRLFFLLRKVRILVYWRRMIFTAAFLTRLLLLKLTTGMIFLKLKAWF